MEKTNLYVAFIVRKVAIKAFVLSQNANNALPTLINKRQIIQIVFMGPKDEFSADHSLQPPLGLVVVGVYDLDAEAEQKSVEERIGEISQIIKKHIETVAPYGRIAVRVTQINSLVQPNPSL